eukprot:m.65954 g.65954  ORF g.65954 m.65954 type:complete len:197 (+) comp35349_c0_seq4:162-752(+)
MIRRYRLFVKRHWLVLGLVSVFCIIFLYSFPKEDNEATPSERPPAEFRWHSLVNLSSVLTTCRNSVQGRHLITDELGYACKYRDVKPNGCCNVNRFSTQRFTCSDCLDNGCCRVYEHCISCCLHPDKQPLLRSIRSRAVDAQHTLLSSVRDQFELCLAKCRTSSLSVQHENSYRDPQAKYCYGAEQPELLREPVNN